MSTLSRWEAVTKIMSALCPEGKEIYEQGLEGIRQLIEEAEELGLKSVEKDEDAIK